MTDTNTDNISGEWKNLRCDVCGCTFDGFHQLSAHGDRCCPECAPKIPVGENAVANPASQEQSQHSAAAGGLEASGVTGGRDRQPLPDYPSRTLQMESGRYVPWDDWLDMRCRAGQLEQQYELAEHTCLEYCEIAGEMAAVLDWIVARAGECLGDHPKQLAYAERVLAKARAKREGRQDG